MPSAHVVEAVGKGGDRSMKVVLIPLLLFALFITILASPWYDKIEDPVPPPCPANTLCYTAEGAPYR